MGLEFSCRTKRSLFFFLLICMLVLPFMLRIFSLGYVTLNRLPAASCGKLDLSSIDFDQHAYLPLDQGWLFYPDTFLVSDYILHPWPDAEQIRPPFRMGPTVHGSFAMHINGFPGGENLYVYIPDQLTNYRIYWNQLLVASNNSSSSSRFGTPLFLNRLPVPYNYQGELIIEVEGASTASLMGTPILTTADFYTRITTVSNTISGLIYGAILFCIIMYSALCLSTGKTFRSHQLLVTLLFTLIYFLVRDSASNLTGYLMPILRRPEATYLAQFLLILLPMIILSYDVQQLGLPVKRAEKLLLIGSSGGSVLCFLIHLSCASSQAFWHLCCLFWLLAAMIPLRYLFRCIQKELPYALLLSFAQVALFTGILVDLPSNYGYFIFLSKFWFPLLVVCCLLLLVFFYQQKVVRLQEKVKQAQENELAMAQMRLKVQQSEAALMLSQIRPHFLYNALISIHDVNRENPDLANRAIIQFANYLRGNIRSIGSNRPIPFLDELHHIENYVAIEKLRFEDRLEMVYDIRYSDFAVPPLTVQPLVENAIKHGICKRLAGGQVILRSWKENDYIYISIEDNGIGFRTDLLADRPDSIGITNVRTRLQTIPGATLTINSTPNVGTTVQITLREGDSKIGSDQNPTCGR